MGGGKVRDKVDERRVGMDMDPCHLRVREKGGNVSFFPPSHRPCLTRVHEAYLQCRDSLCPFLVLLLCKRAYVRSGSISTTTLHPTNTTGSLVRSYHPLNSRPSPILLLEP